MADQVTIVGEDHGPRRPRTVIAAVHVAVLLALVLGSGAVRPAAPDAPSRQVSAERPNAVPQPLHRSSTCCAGSSDPSMEVY